MSSEGRVSNIETGRDLQFELESVPCRNVSPEFLQLIISIGSWLWIYKHVKIANCHVSKPSRCDL